MVGYCGAGRLQQSLQISMLPIRNGFECWFTFVIYPVVELTNLREHVVLRKILGTLRNSEGTSIRERIMTVLAT